MSWSIKIARVMGIDIKVHLTFPLLLVFSAAMGGTPGVILTLLTFVCVVLHELGHCYFALRFGGRVVDIVLLPIGGMARMTRIPEKPLHEITIALAGPAVNFAIAFFLWAALLRFTPVSPWNLGDEFFGRASWTTTLLVINIHLGLFNLIPAFPMDGGRVLRGLLGLRLNFYKATLYCARTGRLFAVGFFLAGMATDHFFLLLISVFIWITSREEEFAVGLRHALGQARVRDIMGRMLIRLDPGESLAAAAQKAAASSQIAFPVVQGDRLFGMVLKPRLLGAARFVDASQPVVVCMDPRPLRLAPDQDLFSAFQLMLSSRVPCLPVLENGAPLGLVTLEEMEKYLELDPAMHRAELAR